MRFLNTWNSISVQLAERFATDPRTPAQFLRSIQLLTAVYWDSINASSAMGEFLLPPPNFVELLTSLGVHSWVPPILPGAQFIMPHSTPPPLGPALAPAPTSSPASDPARVGVVNPLPIPDIQTAMAGRQFSASYPFEEWD